MTYPLPQAQLEDLELRYVPLPMPEEVQGWLKLAYEAGIAAGLEAAGETE